MITKGDREEKITKYQNGKAMTIALEGRLDTLTAPELDKEFAQSLSQADELTLDFAGLDYISSAGLRVLAVANQKMSGKGGMKIINASELVREVFEVTGFNTIIKVE